MSARRTLAAGLVIALLPASAWAHPGHAAGSFAAGVAHPLLGLDHLLAMVAVGLWAGQCGGRARWALPAAFVGVMTLGGALGMYGVALPLVEAGILASVLALGILVAFAARLPLTAGLPIVGAFALLHGHAHGAELPAAGSGAAYVAGFVAATAALHAAGLALALFASRSGGRLIVRVSGAAIAAAGFLLALS